MCIAGGKPCCSSTRVPKSIYIRKDTLDSHITAKVRAWSETQQRGLAVVTHSQYVLKCQPTSFLEIGASYQFTLMGHFNISNHGLVAQLDLMVADTWAPEIRAKDGAVESIPLACLGIGYCNMLIFTNLQDTSDSPFDKHDVSPIFAELAVVRINELITNFMSLIRNDQYELNAESRPWVVLWYLYSSIIRTKLLKLGHCKLLDNLELFNLVREIFLSIRKEVRALLARDCQKKVDWTAAFEDSQRSLLRKLRAEQFCTLSVKWVALPMQSLGLAYFEPVQVYQSDHQLEGAASANSPSDFSRNEAVTNPYSGAMWTGLNSTISPSVTASFVHDEWPTSPGRASETTDPNFNQTTDTSLDIFANQDGSPFVFPQQDGFGEYDTFFLALNLMPRSL